MWRQARQTLLIGLGFGLAGTLSLIGLRHVYADEAAVELRRLATAVGNGVDGLQATRTGRGASERSAAVEALVTSLDGASAWARANPGTSAAGPEGAAIAKAIAWACASEVVDVTPAAVRAAGWFPHPAATAAFQGTGSRWVLLGPAKAYFTITEGSPPVSERQEVLDAGGEPIPGLYAVGQNGLGGQILWGHGLHIAWAMTSGRLVGRHLARMERER